VSTCVDCCGITIARDRTGDRVGFESTRIAQPDTKHELHGRMGGPFSRLQIRFSPVSLDFYRSAIGPKMASSLSNRRIPMKASVWFASQVFLCLTMAFQLTAQEKPRQEQEMESIWIVSQAYIPGGQKFPTEYTDEEHAKRVYESLKSAKGLDDKQLYFDVTIESGQRPVFKPSSGYDPKPRDNGEAKSKSAISLPDLKIVDPGGSAHSKRKSTPSNKAKLIRGKKFAAVIGNVNVTLDFGINDKVTIASAIQGKSLVADWYFDEKDRLVIDAFNADFIADLKGDRFVGIRATKDRSDQRPWSFSLQDVADASNSRGQAYNDPRVEAKPEKRFWVERRHFTVNQVWDPWFDVGPSLPVLNVSVGGGPYTKARAEEVMNLAKQDWFKTVEQDEISRNGFGVGYTRDEYEFRIVEKDPDNKR
jgi:hypothetical protein